jgi:TetR/AcrR family transcriptional regulator, repressor for uid operon
MPRLSPDRLQERRDSLLEGCMRCFAVRGFHQTSMRDLCDALEISPGGLYRYFKSKEEIIVTLIEKDRQQWQQALALLPRDQTLEQSLKSLIQFAKSTHATDPAMGRVWLQVIAEAATKPEVAPILRDHYAAMTDEIEALVKRAQKRGEVSRRFSAKVLGTFLMSAFDGLLLRIVVDPSAAVDTLTRDFQKIIHYHLAPLREEMA